MDVQSLLRHQGISMSDVHPRAMHLWPEIRCRSHTAHVTKTVTVSLGGPTPYHDYTSIPMRLARSFKMEIYDWERYAGTEGYCPGNDAVSETIDKLGIWEPRETVLALHVLTSQPGHVLDMGAQLGWFSLLALSAGCSVHAYDADPDNLRALEVSALAQPRAKIVTRELRIGPDTEPMYPRRVRFAKLDLEGAEDEAVRMLWPTIEAGLLDHMLIEVSPCFADYYPDLMVNLVDAGFRVYLLPPKSTPPHEIDDPERDLAPWRLDTLSTPDLRARVASWTQEDVWLRREEASW